MSALTRRPAARRLTDAAPGDAPPPELRVVVSEPAADLPAADPPRPEASYRGGGRLVAGALVTLALLGGLFGLAVFHADLAEGRFVLEDLEAQERTLGRQLTELRIEVARLEAPARVGDVAAGFGMVAPEPGSTTFLTPNPAVVADITAGVAAADAVPPGADRTGSGGTAG